MDTFWDLVRLWDDAWAAFDAAESQDAVDHAIAHLQLLEKALDLTMQAEKMRLTVQQTVIAYLQDRQSVVEEDSSDGA